MRSLTAKLTLAFLIVGVIGALLVAVFANAQTGREFDRFLLAQVEQRLTNELQAYYAEHGSWIGVEQALRGQRVGGGIPALSLVTLLDADGRPIAGAQPRGRGGPPIIRPSAALPLEVNGDTVGWLLLDVARLRGPDQVSEEIFRMSVRRAVLLSALGAALVALVVGLLLARTITRPIRDLTTATQTLMSGELGRQAPVHARDEIGDLATSFNQMSRELARAAQLRRQMTADIAHDLRSPLSVILGYSEALSDGKLQGSSQIYDTMYNEAQHLSRLIDDLRTLSLADAGELSLDRRAIAPRALLERAAAAYAARAQEQDIALLVATDDALPTVYVDPERIAQVLGNLVGNALRHTPAGGQVTLGASRDDSADTAQVRLSVTDTGEGIAQADLPNIFERFYRGDQARSANGESGLGLPIAKSLVEAHGGTIAVRSEPNNLTEFRLTLPCNPSTSQPSPSTV